MNFSQLIKEFKFSITCGLLLIVVILLKNSYPENKFISILSYLVLVNYIIVFIYELNNKFVLKKEFHQMGFGKQETTISKFIKNKRQILGLSVDEVVKKLHSIGLQLSTERFLDIESGKSDPTGEEFLQIKSVLNENTLEIIKIKE